MSIKNSKITKTGTMCEVRQKDINFTTFVVCTTRGWSTIQSLYECSLFHVKFDFESIDRPLRNFCFLFFLFPYQIKGMKEVFAKPDKNDFLISFLMV